MKKRNIYKGVFLLVGMEKMQVIIISLLIIAIVFSVVSMVMNFSFDEFKKIHVSKESNIPAGNPNGNINLVVEGNPKPAGGE